MEWKDADKGIKARTEKRGKRGKAWGSTGFDSEKWRDKDFRQCKIGKGLLSKKFILFLFVNIDSFVKNPKLKKKVKIMCSTFF